MNDPDPTTGRAGPGLEPTLERAVRQLIAERRSDRNWRIFFRLAWFVLIVAVVWSLLSRAGPAVPVGSTPHTALVEIYGEIAIDAEASADRIVGALREAFEDEGAVAIVLRINSGGGSPVQAGIVNDEITRLKALHGKKVYAVVEEICASGAYYIAAAADEIVVDKASLVGSIGVLMESFGFADAMARLGIERRLITAGDNKALLDPFLPADPAQTAYVQATLEQIHRQFIAAVQAGRGDRLVPAPDTFSGLFWNGEEAVRLGLADRLGNLGFVARELVGAEEIIDYTRQDSFAERVAKRFGAAVGEGMVRTLRTMSPIR